jgi:excisionase family DNA binding protein
MKVFESGNTPARREIRPKEAAARIGCSIGYVYALMKEGQLEHRAVVRRGRERGLRLITLSSVEKFLSQPEGASV